MKKRIVSLILVMSILLSLITVLPFTVNAATSGTCGDGLTWTLDDAGTLVITGMGAMRNWTDSSPAPWESFWREMTSVIIADGVTSIGSFAFSWSTYMTNITIPDSVTSIGSYAFYYCDSLTNIIIPNSVTSIGDHVFDGCYSLTDVCYRGNESDWENVSISACGNEPLTNARIHFADDMGTIECLTYIITDEEVTIVACDDNVESELTIPSTIEGCPVTSIGGGAFGGRDSLTSVTIPDRVTSIGDNAFDWCWNLTSATIPDSVITIGNRAFYDCNSLTDVYYAGTEEQWNQIDIADGNECLTNATIHYVEDDVDDASEYLTYTIENEEVTIVACDDNVEGELIIPSTIEGYPVTSIGDWVFNECYSLTNVAIPDSVTSIGDYAFVLCNSLTSITIPDGVTSIGNGVFSKCWNLKNITIPDGITSIGSYAFEECNNLRNITIPDSVTSIGDYAFVICNSLTSITIPDGVTSIGEGVFAECWSLTNVAIPYGVITIGEGAFCGCYSLASVTIPDSVISIGDYAFSGCSGITDIIIPEGVTIIGNCTFENCSGLTHLVIPDSVTTIDIAAFYGCSGLMMVAIPDSVTYIGEMAFNDCDSLTDIYYGGNKAGWDNVSIVAFGNDCLINATVHYVDNAEYLIYTITNGEVTLETYGNYTASEFTIPSTIDGYPVTSIGDGAFANLSNLTNITIPDSVITIGNRAFYDCNSLTDVYYAGTEEQWNQIDIVYGNEPLAKATIYYGKDDADVTKVSAKVASCIYEDNKVIANIDFECVPADCEAIFAVYTSEGKFVDISSALVAAADLTGEIILMTDTDYSGYYYKIYFWESINSPKPMGEALEGIIE